MFTLYRIPSSCVGTRTILDIACVVGVKRGRGRGNLGAQSVWGARGRKERSPSSFLPPPSRAVSRPNSLSFPFRTPATQAILDRASVHTQERWFRRDFFNGAKLCRSDLKHQYCRYDVIWKKTSYTHPHFWVVKERVKWYTHRLMLSC